MKKVQFVFDERSLLTLKELKERGLVIPPSVISVGSVSKPSS